MAISEPRRVNKNNNLAAMYTLFVDKTVFLEKKAHFFGNKTVDQRFGANSKKTVFAEICCKFLAFLGFLQQKR